MAESTNFSQLAVIGAGPGGYAAAFHAADLGLDVTLIDTESNPGGTCLYVGCIPSKALLHIARVISETKEARAWGVNFGEPTIDLDQVRGWKDDVVGRLTGGLGQLSKQRKVNYIQGRALFESPTAIGIESTSNGRSRLGFQHAILATGSVPSTIPLFEIDSPRVMDSTAALKLLSVPKTLLVVGGGYIGLELGVVYAALGSAVTVVEMTVGLLPGVDKDLTAVLAKRLKGVFEAIMLNTTIDEFKEQKNGVRVKFKGSEAGGQDKLFEKVLVSIGRKPNTAGLGIDNTRMKLNSHGFVQIDDRRRTAEPTVFAIGDAAGNPMLAHKASHEGRIAAEVIAGRKVLYDPQAIPAVVFTDPEIAWCGLTETEAKERGLEVRVVKFPWGASGRAMSIGRTDGLTKLLIDPNSERVLGVGIVGPGAGELIAEGVLAIEMGATAEDVGLTIHPHPTLSETVMEAADMFYGFSTHVTRKR